MVKQTTGRKRSGGGTDRRKRADYVEPSLKRDPDFTTSARRALAFRRFWLFLLAAVLVLIGLASVVRARFF